MLCSCSVNRHKGMGIMIRCTYRTHDWSLDDTEETSVLHLMKTFFTFNVKMRLRTFFFCSEDQRTWFLWFTRVAWRFTPPAGYIQHPHYLLRAIKGWACCGCASYHESAQADQNTRARILPLYTRIFPASSSSFYRYCIVAHFSTPLLQRPLCPFATHRRKKPNQTKNKTKSRLVDVEATDERRLNMERKPLTCFFHWSKWDSAVWTQHVNSGRRDVGKGQLYRDARCLVKRPPVLHFWHSSRCQGFMKKHSSGFSLDVTLESFSHRRGGG